MNRDEYVWRVKRMNPIDDDLFKKMAEDKDFCEELIRTVMEDEKLEILEVKPQDTVKNLQGRSVILDLHCMLTSGRYVNVEVQKADDDDHQRRSRYNGSCVTANITDPGSKFEKVPDVCVIYITKNDFFKKGKTTYHVDRVLRETGDFIENGFSEIYVNTKVKDGSQISQLMTIFTENDVYDTEKFPATSRRKRHFKEDEKRVGEMCEIMREVKEEGIAEGIERGISQTIVQMYREGIIDIWIACEKLNCTPEEFEGYLKEYTKQEKNR